MVVMVLERVSPSVRGELTRWMLELRAGVFVGTVSAMVRDRLWTMVCEKLGKGAGILVHSADNEQGFALRVAGEGSKEVVDFEGLQLVRTP